MRQAGPRWNRCACGAPLASGEGACCEICRPPLSLEAQAAAQARRARDAEIVAAEREAELLATAIRKLGRRLYRWR